MKEIGFLERIVFLIFVLCTFLLTTHTAFGGQVGDWFMGGSLQILSVKGCKTMRSGGRST